MLGNGRYETGERGAKAWAAGQAGCGPFSQAFPKAPPPTATLDLTTAASAFGVEREGRPPPPRNHSHLCSTRVGCSVGTLRPRDGKGCSCLLWLALPEAT